MRRLVYGEVAVVAIHAEVARMQFVTVGHRLRRLIAGHDYCRVAYIHRQSSAAHSNGGRGQGPDSDEFIGRFRKD